MSFQSEHGVIRWKLHFTSSREIVFDALATDSGRARYWAESAPEHNDVITFHILGYKPSPGKILQRDKPSLFLLEYFGTNVKFELRDDGADGTDLLLTATQVDESFRMEMVAGWVSVLMAMKAAVDHGVDLRNHNEKRSWIEGYVDN
jgi:uncharacterized protein YndB with AHSA1/START domain